MASNKKYEKEEKRNQSDQKKANTSKTFDMDAYRAKFSPAGFDPEKNATKITAAHAQKLYDSGSTVVYTSPSGKKTTYGKLLGKDSNKKTFHANRYSSTKPEEMNLAQRVAYMRDSGASQEEWQLLADSIQNPATQFYNPYWKGRSTQTAAMEFFRNYFGTDDIRFDQQFFDDNIGLRQFTKRSDITHNLTQPSQRDSEDVWAAYYYESLLADKQYSDNATEQWGQLRNDVSTFYNNYQTIHGRKPTMDEFLASIDITDYSVLYSMDASRNIGSDKSSKVVQLNTGCNYSTEALIGLYSVLSSGGDISEDRDYFEDAVQYYMHPYEEAAARQNALVAMGFNTSGWSDEDYIGAMQTARKAGDSAAYEALKQERWQMGEHMDSVDTMDYLGERFGYNKDANYFASIRSVYQPIWNEMYTDSSRSSIKKPNSSDDMVYHAAYQAWQECQGEEDLNKVEAQAQAFLKEIDSIDTTRWDTQEDYEAYFDAEIAPALEGEEYSELRRYLAGNLTLVRDVFISDEEIKEYVQQHWSGRTQNATAPSQEKEAVVIEPETPPLFFDYEQTKQASDDAAKRNADATKIGQALIALSESGSNVTPSVLAEKGIAVFWGDAVENGAIKDTVLALWNTLKSDSYDEKLGADATFAQKITADPVLKMVSEGDGSEVYNHHTVSMDSIYELIEQQTVSQMSGGGITVADGVIAAAIPEANELFSGIERFRIKYGQHNSVLTGSEFDIASYNDMYTRCKNVGYAPEDAADIAIDAAVFGTAGLKNISLGLETDNDLIVAAQNVITAVTEEEGYPDAVAVVGPIVGEIAAAEDDEVLVQEAKELASSILLGMSEQASPTHSAATKDFLFEVLKGDISSEDIVAGIKNSAKNLTTFARRAVGETLEAYGNELSILGYASGMITTEKYDALSDERRAEVDEIYNQSIGDVTNGGEIINGIIAKATQNGHDEIFGTGKDKAVDSAGEQFMTYVDAAAWAGTVTGLSDETTQEQFKVYSDFHTYGKWLTYDEAVALETAWKNGYITYDDFNSIIMERVSRYTNGYVNGLKNTRKIAEDIQTARTGLDELEAGINHNLEIAESGYSDDVIAEADSALRQIASGNDPVMLVRSNGLAEKR